MANQWFKFYGGEYLADPKIMQLNGQERSCWVTLLCLASQSENGVIKFLSGFQLLAFSGITQVEDNWFEDLLDKLQKLDMIQLSNGDVTIVNWSKRQYSEGYERVKRFREKISNAKDNDRIEENRIEKNINTPFQIAKEFFNNPANKAKYPEFIAWWTEPNKSGTKQKWELEKTFEVTRRLQTWKRNQEKWAQKSGFKNSVMETRPELKNWTQERLSEQDAAQREAAQKKIDFLKTQKPIKTI